MDAPQTGHFVQRRRQGALVCIVVRLSRSAEDLDGDKLLDSVLAEVCAHAAGGLIVDATGLDAVDSQLAEGIANLLKTARCLGAEPALVGVSPGVAAVLVELGFQPVGDNLPCARTVEDGMTLLVNRQHVREAQGAVHGG